MEAQLMFAQSNKEGLKMENLKMKLVSLIRFRGLFPFSLNDLLNIKDEVLEHNGIAWLSFT